MPKVNLTESDRMRERMVVVLRVAMARNGLNVPRLAKKMVKAQDTVRRKCNDPGALTVRELGQLVRMLHIPQEELMEAIYGKQ